MPSSQEEVFNHALVLLKLSPIASFGGEGAKAAWATEAFDQTIEALIVEYPWRMFLKKGQLVRQTSEPVTEWKYKYTLPTDRLGALYAVFNTNAIGANPMTNFELFGDGLFTNEEQIYLDYWYKRPVGEWPAHFTQLAVYELAWKAAMPLTGQASLVTLWKEAARGTPAEQLKGGYYRTATQVDAMGNSPQQFHDFTLIDARHGG